MTDPSYVDHYETIELLRKLGHRVIVVPGPYANTEGTLVIITGSDHEKMIPYHSKSDLQ